MAVNAPSRLYLLRLTQTSQLGTDGPWPRLALTLSFVTQVIRIGRAAVRDHLEVCLNCSANRVNGCEKRLTYGVRASSISQPQKALVQDVPKGRGLGWVSSCHVVTREVRSQRDANKKHSHKLRSPAMSVIVNDCAKTNRKAA